MTTRLRRGCFAMVLFAFGPVFAQDEEIRWKKTAAPDRSFSLHYPDAWTVAHDRGTVTLRNDPSGEQLAMIRLPREGGKQARAYAEQIGNAFRQKDASFRMTDLTVSGENAGFRLQYGQGYSGLGVVIQHPATVFWISYGSLNAGDLQRGGALLSAVAESIADNAESRMPGRLRVSAARGSASQPAAPSTGGVSLIGNWSTTGYYGELVDQATGAPVQTQYSGQWYTFRPDGTYHYVMAGSGRIISGIVMNEGRYEMRGGQLLLHKKTTSWYPFSESAARHPKYTDRQEPQEIVFGLEFHSASEMVVRPATGVADTFRRQPGK